MHRNETDAPLYSRPLPAGQPGGILLQDPIVWEGEAPCPIGAPRASDVPLAGDMSVQQAEGTRETLVYRGKLTLPQTPEHCNLWLRLDSVGCFAVLRLDGAVAATHVGSHTVWECPLPAAAAGTCVSVALELQEGSGVFSPYQKAGVLRGISVVARPKTAIAHAAVQADLHETDGTLRLQYALEGAEHPAALTLDAVLTDASGAQAGQWTLDPAQTEATLCCPHVQGWCAETPTLYTLTLSLRENNSLRMQTTVRTGFTAIERRDPQVFWNGAPLKLRGINYREPLPAEGHDLRADLQRLKEANVNFLRSLFYPFSAECLALCDELGFFVEQSAPFQEVDQGIASTQNTPGERAGYVSQCAEMLRDGLSHPCIVSWCLGSDCSWGANFRACRRLAEQTDAKRLINFFLPMTVPEEEPELPIWSVAYVDWRQPMDARYDQMVIFHTPGACNEIGYAIGSAPQSQKPVLHCMFALPPCYNRDEAARDYGIHEFWGEGIRRFWDRMQTTPACLGGAVMAAADEDGRAFPRLHAHAWGVLDAAHSPKPELHHLAMAYAPVAIAACTQTADGLCVTLQNRFVHTPLSAVRLAYQIGANGVLTEISVQAAPGETVTCLLPASAQDTVTLHYCGGGAQGVLPVRHTAPALPLPAARDGGAYEIRIENACTIAENAHYRFVFDANGSLAQACAGGTPVLTGGPHLQATRLTLGERHGITQSVESTQTGAQAVLTVSYGAVCDVRFVLNMAQDGTLMTRCEILSLSKPMPHSVKAGVGIDPGGLNELGIAYTAAPAAQSVAWTRDALWGACYPKQHIGRDTAQADRTAHDDFTAMKHHITSACLHVADACLAVPPQGELSLRLAEEDDAANVLDDRDERLVYSGAWHCMDDGCGNYRATETLSDAAGAAMEFSFCGTGISLYGPHDFLYGEGEASIDGGTPQSFSQYLAVVDRPGASRGYEKRYGLLLTEFSGLADGAHTLRVTVSGKRPAGAQGAYVSLDRLVVHTKAQQKPVRLILNRDFNYARLVRGNYMRPRVAFTAGDTLEATVRLCAPQQGGDA